MESSVQAWEAELANTWNEMEARFSAEVETLNRDLESAKVNTFELNARCADQRRKSWGTPVTDDLIEEDDGFGGGSNRIKCRSYYWKVTLV